MTIDLGYIQHLAENHEGVDVEFKETTGQLNRGMETLCGMINGSGGVVVFGVSNKGKIIGQEIGDKTTREIGEAINKFDPAVDIQPIYVPVDNSDKYVIVFRTDGLETDKPYMWDGKPYRRHDSVTSVMPREKFIRLHELQHGLKYTWESKVNQQLTIGDLDGQLIQNVIQSAVRRGRLSSIALNDNIQTALERLKLIKDGSICNSRQCCSEKISMIIHSVDCVLPVSEVRLNGTSSTIGKRRGTSFSWLMQQWHSSSNILISQARHITALSEKMSLKFHTMRCARVS